MTDANDHPGGGVTDEPSQRLRHMIEARGHTLTDVSKALDVNLSTVSCWLSGKREPSDQYQAALAEFLGISKVEVADLLPKLDLRVGRTVALPLRTWRELERLATDVGRPLDDLAAELLAALFPGRRPEDEREVTIDLGDPTWRGIEVLSGDLGISVEDLCGRILAAAAGAVESGGPAGRSLLEVLLLSKGRDRPGGEG